MVRQSALRTKDKIMRRAPHQKKCRFVKWKIWAKAKAKQLNICCRYSIFYLDS